MDAPVVVKFGGSAITDKKKICTPRLDLIHRAVGEIASYRKPLILLHGGGSYAHPFATKSRIARSFRGRNGLEAISEIELNLDQLTRIIGVALLLRHRPFVPIRPMSFMTLRGQDVGPCFLRPLTAALDRGVIPVIHGDLVVDERGGFGVVSADRIASLFAEKMPVSRVLFGCDVEGVYPNSKASTIVREVARTNCSDLLKGIRESSFDATGGMRGKVVEALRLARRGVESYIFNLKDPSNLRRLLKGDSSVGTRFVPWNS
jgi:isopentenyl phosphate kinase